MNNIGLGLLTVGALALTSFELTAQCRSGYGGGPARNPDCVAPRVDGGGLRLRLGRGGRSAVARPDGVGGRRLGRQPGGAPPAATGPDLTTRLQLVLTEELRAMDLYRALHGALGLPRYANLARAEANHADAITRLIRSLGGTPDEERRPAVVVPDDLAAARELAANLERRMIDTYAKLLEDVTEPRLAAALTRIQSANRRHLKAASG